jgi:hypothetical protein
MASPEGTASTADPWLEINDFDHRGWSPAVADPQNQARWYTEQLERGQILFFSSPPFNLPEQDREFLVGQRTVDSRLHKNVSYRPKEDILRGSPEDNETQKRTHEIMRAYSHEVTRFVSDFLRPYAGKFQLDFASFRPLEEQNPNLPLHKRNDLLHVDAFPTRPTRGARILRVFTNIHPTKHRVWVVGERFPQLVRHYASDAGLLGIAQNSGDRIRSRIKRLLRAVGLPAVDRSSYDKFMLRFHDYLKENSAFQQNSSGKSRLSFPPMATWLVFTDGVPHAALSGQSALEQTFIIPRQALVAPDDAPISVLEKLCGRELAAVST